MNTVSASRPSSRATVRVSFDADPHSVRHALHFINGALEQHSVPLSLRRRAEQALAEVFNNIVEHAYKGQTGGWVGATLIVGNELICHVADTGHPFRADTIGLAVLPDADMGDPPEGGFGWPLINALTRDIEYQRATGHNVLRFAVPLAVECCNDHWH